MNNDKPVTMKDLSEILTPISEAVRRIDQSLWLMAQLQLAAEFEPRLEERHKYYDNLDSTELAHKEALEALKEARNEKPLSLPDVGHTELVKLYGKEKADAQYKHIIDAMELVTATSNERTAAAESAPVLTRLHEAWKR